MVKSGVTSTWVARATVEKREGPVLRIKGLVFVTAMVVALWVAGGSPFPKCC